MNKTTIKKWIKRLAILSAFCIFIFICLTGLIIHALDEGCSQIPEKPANIPQSAVWTGECETGHWVNLVEIHDEDKYRFRTYRGHDGVLLIDADFVVEGEENNNRQFLNEDNWQDKIKTKTSEFDDDFVPLKRGKLKCVLPAYGGELWDDKEWRDSWATY
jgi:hypothetical protein